MFILSALLFSYIAYSQAISYQILIEEQWENFKLEHHKIYESEREDRYRQSIFMENLHKINGHNKLYEMGLTSYKMAMNKFGDLPVEEFMRLYTMKNRSLISDLRDGLPESMDDFIIYAPPINESDVSDLPESIDWRDKGYVTPVKDQGDYCGSCWTFSTTGVLEGQWFRKTSKLVSLSEQNLLDCSWKYGNTGCDGGWVYKALRYIKENGGIDTEASYPYEGKDLKCQYNPQHKGAIVSKVIIVPRREKQLQIKLGTIGPMSVAIEVRESFQFYHTGVYDDPMCRRNLDHAVLAVGYGSQDGKDYWLVKNSCGSNWGDRGYIRMSRNKRNQCGIADEVSYPLV